MADPLDVLSLTEAKAVLKITDSDSARDLRLARVITAVSRRLDDLCGPIVKRTVTSEAIPNLYGQPSLWLRYAPIYSTPGLTVTSYDSSGAATVYTAEDFDTKPSYGYRLEPRDGLGTGYTSRIWARSSSGPGTWGDHVVVTYTAGRYADTGTVDPVFKEAAAVCLINWWEQVLAQPAVPLGTDLETPYYRFPKAGIPPAAIDIIPESEIMSVPVVA